MADETKTYVFDNTPNDGLGNGFLTGMLAGSMNNGFGAGMLGGMCNGGFGFGNGFGNDIAGLIGLAIVASIFGWGGNGNGLFGNNGNMGGAGFLANQLNNDEGRALIMQALQGTDSDIRQLASTINCDFSSVKDAICGINSTLATIGSQHELTALQVINAIQSGNSALASQFAQCCCDNKLLATQQGYENRIAIADQTNTLSTQGLLNTRAITDAISAQTNLITSEFCALKERELQNKIDTLTAANSTLKGQIDNSNQTAQITGYINTLIAPIQKEVSEIRASQPNTVSVPYPNLTAVNTTPALYGFGYGLGYGNWNNNGSI